MSFDWIRQKIIFVNGFKNPIYKKKSSLPPGILTITTLIFLHYVFSIIPCYYITENIFLAIFLLPALIKIVTNYPVSMQSKKNVHTTYIILPAGFWVILSLFPSHKNATTSYPWRLLNNYQIYQQHMNKYLTKIISISAAVITSLLISGRELFRRGQIFVRLVLIVA